MGESRQNLSAHPSTNEKYAFTVILVASLSSCLFLRSLPDSFSKGKHHLTNPWNSVMSSDRSPGLITADFIVQLSPPCYRHLLSG